MDYYELRHACATILLELEPPMRESDVAVQLGHTDGGRLVQELYGHPDEASARRRLLAAWDDPKPVESGAIREQAS